MEHIHVAVLAASAGRNVKVDNHLHATCNGPGKNVVCEVGDLGLDPAHVLVRVLVVVAGLPVARHLVAHEIDAPCLKRLEITFLAEPRWQHDAAPARPFAHALGIDAFRPVPIRRKERLRLLYPQRSKIEADLPARILKSDCKRRLFWDFSPQVDLHLSFSPIPRSASRRRARPQLLTCCLVPIMEHELVPEPCLIRLGHVFALRPDCRPHDLPRPGSHVDFCPAQRSPLARQCDRDDIAATGRTMWDSPRQRRTSDFGGITAIRTERQCDESRKVRKLGLSR